ncbi:DNA mismatch repair protein Mlh1 [Blattella germanica]|nr:DNA mismatch repair protein Mlh1 [Blattella germanica]
MTTPSVIRKLDETVVNRIAAGEVIQRPANALKEMLENRASYEDSKLKGTPKPCAGNQGTQITVEDLFYNVATRRKALKSPTEEHNRIAEVVGRYAIHNAKVGFSLKKQGESLADIRTPPNSTVLDNIKVIFGASVANVYIPKQNHPFLYISLELDPRNVDVNVHPTKHEVHFLHEDSVLEKIKQAVEARLLGSNTSRVFYTQARLPSAKITDDKPTDNASKMYAHQMSMVILFRVECKLRSVLELRTSVEKTMHVGLRDLLKNSCFVGCVSPRLALIQHETKLYLCNTAKLSEELFYQILLYDFGNFGEIKFTNPLPLYETALLGLNSEESGWKPEDGDKDELGKSVEELLQEKSPMLDEYFSTIIDSQANLCSLPLLLDQYSPAIEGIPMYLLHLATDVEWDTEKECFETFCRETARFYSEQFGLDEWEDVPVSLSQKENDSGQDLKWTVEHVIYPALRSFFLPPKSFSEDGTVLQIANLPDLYKVFERC